MKTEIHLFSSSQKQWRDFIYIHIWFYIYVHDMVLQKTGLLWLSHIKLVLIFKAIHKQSFVFFLHATPPFLALAHFLSTLLHVFIRAHSLPGEASAWSSRITKPTWIYTEAKREGYCHFFSLPPLALVWSHAPDDTLLLWMCRIIF